MSVSTHTLLVEIVERHRESDGPVTRQTLSLAVDESEAELCQSLQTLREFELVEATEDGYRPTVTAHELLELDVDFEDVLVLDIVEG